MGTGTRIEHWDATSVLGKTQDELVLRMTRATMYVRDQVKRSINRGNPKGDNPSKEGEPPKKVSTRLFQSITQAVVVEGGVVRGLVGTNVIYARRLELGYVGIDKAGRKISQGPRPFLRPGIEHHAGAIKKILGIA